MHLINSTPVRIFVAAVLAFAAGLATAQQTENRNSRTLQFVPRDALAVLSVQSQLLLSNKMIASAAPEIGGLSLPLVPVELSKLKDFTIVVLNTGAFSKLNLTSEGKQELWKRVSTQTNEATFNEVKFYKNRDGIFHQLMDGNILVATNETILMRALRTESAESTVWAEQWDASKSPFQAMLNTSLLRANPIVGQLMIESIRLEGGPMRMPNEVFGLALRSDQLWLDFQFDPVPQLKLRGRCPSNEESIACESAVRTAISLARNWISISRQSMLDPSQGRGSADTMQLMDFLDRTMEFATVERKEKQVAAVVRVPDADAMKVPGMLTMGLKSFASVRKKASSQNNLKQIALAIHNYESTYKRIPASIQEGPNKVPHSWRVSILPYLEQTDLYNRYKQDEPWDSPSNLKVLNEIPAVYQGEKGGINAAYFVFDGPNAIFNRNRVPRFSEITDGTSNTILAVEAELDIPWTKPEDIPIDIELPLFLKNGFNTVTADGMFHYVKPNVDEESLRAAINKNDGQVTTLFDR